MNKFLYGQQMAETFDLLSRPIGYHEQITEPGKLLRKAQRRAFEALSSVPSENIP